MEIGTIIFLSGFSPLTIGGQSLSSVVYEIVPGVLFSAIAIVGVSLTDKQPSHAMQTMFEAMVARLREQS